MPLIATDVGGIPEIVAGSDTPLLPAGDVQALARALQAFLDDPGRQRRVRCGCSRRCRSASLLVRRRLPCSTSTRRTGTRQIGPANLNDKPKRACSQPSGPVARCVRLMGQTSKEPPTNAARRESFHPAKRVLRRSAANPNSTACGLPLPRQIEPRLDGRHPRRRARLRLRHHRRARASRLRFCYVDEPIVVGRRSLCCIAMIGMALTTVAGFDLLQPLLPAGINLVHPPYAARVPRLDGGLCAAHCGIVLSQSGTRVLPRLVRALVCSGRGRALAERFAVGTVVHHWTRQGRLFRRAAIYGGGTITETLIGELEIDVDSDVRIMGVFDDRGDDRVDRVVAGYPRLGGLTSSSPSPARPGSTSSSSRCRSPPRSALLAVDALARRSCRPRSRCRRAPPSCASRRGTYSRIGNVAMIDLLEKPIADWGTVSKWLFDKIVGLLALLLLAPLMLRGRRAPSSSTAAARCCSGRSATASTTS